LLRTSSAWNDDLAHERLARLNWAKWPETVNDVLSVLEHENSRHPSNENRHNRQRSELGFRGHVELR
jgi:hypothetical protein